MSASSIGSHHRYKKCDYECIVENLTNGAISITGSYCFSGKKLETVYINFPPNNCDGDYIGSDNSVTCDLWSGFSKPPSWFRKSEYLYLWFKTGPVCTKHSRCQTCNTHWKDYNNVGILYGTKDTQSVIFKGNKIISTAPILFIMCTNCAKNFRDTLVTKRIKRLTNAGIKVLKALITDFSYFTN